MLTTPKQYIACSWLFYKINYAHKLCLWARQECCVSMLSPLFLKSYGGSQLLGTMQKMDCCIKCASPYLSYFSSTPFPFLCLPGLTIQTPYSQTIKTQHLLMVALTSVPLEYNNIIPFSYSPLKPSRFCSAVVAPAFYSWKHASYFLSLGSLSLFICSSSNSLFLSLSSYSF